MQEFLKTVLRLKAWNTEQLKVFKMTSNLKSRIGLVEAFPNCGKATIFTALAVLYHLAGLYVLIVGPSIASVDAITQRFVDLTCHTGSVDRVSRWANTFSITVMLYISGNVTLYKRDWTLRLIAIWT